MVQRLPELSLLKIITMVHRIGIELSVFGHRVNFRVFSSGLLERAKFMREKLSYVLLNEN